MRNRFFRAVGQRGSRTGAASASGVGEGHHLPALSHGRGVLAAVVAVMGVALLLWLREPLSDWLWDDSQVQQLRLEAAQALQAGVLTRSDGRGARELYEAAVALDPDRPETRRGLTLVGQAALAQAHVAIGEGRYDDAHAALRLARELSVPRAQSDSLAERLRQREFREAGVERLLAQATSAREAGRLDGDEEAALPIYGRVLSLEPNHTRALEGREDILSDLLQSSAQAMQRGDLAAAKRLIGRVQEVDAGHVGLPDAMSDMSQAVRLRLHGADADLRRGRLVRALAGYDAVVDVDPDNEEGRQGRVRVANAYARRSERHAADFRFVQAAAALRDARAIAPEAPSVAAAQQHLARARQSRATLDSAVPAGEQRLRVQRLLQEAAAAETRGELMSPPGASAFDKVRAALAIAPRNKSARAAAARLLPSAQACFEQALRGNRLNAAAGCLDAMEALGDSGSSGSPDARRRLARRWIAVGDERLGAGELSAARGARDAARALDPEVDGLHEFSSRLGKATAAD